jgi:phage terminase large subunit-like protein
VPSDLHGGSWESAYSKQDRELRFANGSTIQMSSADSELEKHAGTSRHWVWVDEECPKAYWTENRARVIDTGGSIWITMTAVDGQTWTYDDLYLPGTGEDPTVPRNPRIFVVKVQMTDNPYLTQEARDDFISGLDEEDKAARVHGDYAVIGGRIFKKFSTALHVVPATEPPPSWPIYASMDHGLNAPTSWQWHAVGPAGQILTFHEEYDAGITVPSWGERVLAYEAKLGRIPEYRVGDPSIRNQTQANGAIVSVQGDYAKAGVHIMLGSNDVPASINRIRRYLERPGMWQITEDCPQTIRQVQRYRWRTPISSRTRERTNPIEEPVKKDDHAVDSVRYFFMSRPDLKTLGPDLSPPPPAPKVPGTTTTSWPAARVVPSFTPATERDPDTVPGSEWEINESMGAIW